MLSISRAAEILDISTKTLRRLILTKDIQTYEVGSRIRLKQTDLEVLVSDRG